MVSPPSPQWHSASFNSSTTLAQSAILGSTWPCRPAREIGSGDWLEVLADFPEDVRNLHVQYKTPGYIPQGRVGLNGTSPPRVASRRSTLFASVVRTPSGSFLKTFENECGEMKCSLVNSRLMSQHVAAWLPRNNKLTKQRKALPNIRDHQRAGLAYQRDLVLDEPVAPGIATIAAASDVSPARAKSHRDWHSSLCMTVVSVLHLMSNLQFGR